MKHIFELVDELVELSDRQWTKPTTVNLCALELLLLRETLTELRKLNGRHPDP